jgi:ABC-2 type transport system permease protein
VNRLIRTELLKQRTLRTFIVSVGATPVFVALLTVAGLAAAGHQDNEPLSPASLNHLIAAPASVIAALALLLGVIGMTGEYRHQTITNAFLARPRRSDVVVSKLAAHAITGVLLGLASLTVTLAIGLPWLAASGIELDVGLETARIALGVIVSSALYGALGVSIGALVRNQTAACAVVLTWLLAIEDVIGNVFHESEFLRWLPVAAGRAMVRTDAVGDVLPVPLAVAAFTTYVALFGFTATRLTLQRDVT